MKYSLCFFTEICLLSKKNSQVFKHCTLTLFVRCIPFFITLALWGGIRVKIRTCVTVVVTRCRSDLALWVCVVGIPFAVGWRCGDFPPIQNKRMRSGKYLCFQKIEQNDSNDSIYKLLFGIKTTGRKKSLFPVRPSPRASHLSNVSRKFLLLILSLTPSLSERVDWFRPLFDQK